MGALILDEAMVRRSAQRQASSQSTPLFNELIMSNADMDAKTFLNHANLFDTNAAKTRIYISTKDSRMEASALSHGGFNRLGEPGELTEDLSKTGEQEVVDITANDTGHELPFWVVANFHRFGGLGPVKEFEIKKEGPSLLRLVRTGEPSQEAIRAKADEARD